VLVVEDNLANQRVATLQLRSLGVSADVASDGEEALRALALRSYSLVFMDCQMPGMDGLETTRRIRAREHGETRTRIVALTAHALPAERRRCEEAGMDAVLTKPLRRETLAACLARFLGETMPSDLFSSPPPPMILELVQIGGTKLVEEMLKGWRERERARFERLRTLVLARECSEASDLAHALKGVAATTGLESLTTLLTQLERDIRESNWSPAQEAVELLGEYFEKDVRAVRHTLDSIVAAQGSGPLMAHG
jgi:CheY-like chemotaxis protein/HPt (histidine-containing phosphotransfer) domain-containing protein